MFVGLFYQVRRERGGEGDWVCVVCAVCDVSVCSIYCCCVLLVVR